MDARICENSCLEFTLKPATWPLTDFIFKLTVKERVVEQAVFKVDTLSSFTVI